MDIPSRQLLGALAIVLVNVGCATQQSVDDLNKKLAETNARITKIETKDAQDKANLTQAIDVADAERLGCRVKVENEYNGWLENNGTPVKGKPGVYNASQQGLKIAKEEEDRADSECQKEYEDAIQIAKLKYGQ
jgi:hypothetical protein